MISSLILTIRALSTEFAKRLFIPVFFIALGALIILIGLGIWLIHLSVWWWILLVILFIAMLLFIAASTLFVVILGIVTPGQTPSQREMVRKFVDKLQEISDTIQTPKVFLIARLVWDALNKNEDGLVHRMSSHTLTTKRDFDEIRKSFERT